MADMTGNMAPKAPGVKVTATANVQKEKRYRIIISEGGEKEPDTAFVGVNGVGYQITRGVEVIVPESVVHVLTNAVQTLWTKRKDDQGREYMASRRVPRYPFTNLGEVRDQTDNQRAQEAA